MALASFGVRIPEEMRKYIQHKAIDTGKQQQEIIVEMIALYQQHDDEYMAKFQPLTQTNEEAKSGA